MLHSRPVNGPSEDGPQERRIRLRWAAYLGLGLEMGLTVAGLTWLGHYLDERWGTAPWLLLTGGLVGAASALALLIRIAKGL